VFKDEGYAADRRKALADAGAAKLSVCDVKG
jgi:hypothetical protein